MGPEWHPLLLQSDQSLCLSLEYYMSIKLLPEHYLEFLSLETKEAAQARLSLRLSKYHIVGNHMSRLMYKLIFSNQCRIVMHLRFKRHMKNSGNDQDQPKAPRRKDMKHWHTHDKVNLIKK